MGRSGLPVLQERMALLALLEPSAQREQWAPKDFKALAAQMERSGLPVLRERTALQDQLALLGLPAPLALTAQSVL